MTCPSCSAGRLAPLTGICELCGYSARSAVAVEQPDVVVERARQELANEFEILDPIGRGPRSAVFVAVERSSGRRVVLKVRSRGGEGPDADQIFRAALATHASLDHPHLVPVTRFGLTDSLRWYTREDLHATSLREVIRQGTTLDARAARRLATQLTSALEYLHRRGIIHCALKPENVLLDRNGWAHLCDPAIALDVGGLRPSWRAPEEFERGERFPAADQYALAAVLAEALTGHPVEEGDVLGQLARADVPSHTAAAIARALADEPRDRFTSLADLVWALEAGAPSMSDARPRRKTSGSVMFIADWEPTQDPARPRRIAARVATAAAILVGGAFLAWLVTPTITRLVRPPQPLASLPVAEVPVPVAPTTPSRSDATVPAPSAPRPAPARPAAPVVAADPARLFVSSDPWGQLFVDGRLIGNTPRTNIELTPGEHMIRVTREGFQPFERLVRVRSGEVVRLTGIVLAPRTP